MVGPIGRVDHALVERREHFSAGGDDRGAELEDLAVPCGERNLTPSKSSIFWIGFFETRYELRPTLTSMTLFRIGLAEHLQAAAMMEPGIGLIGMLEPNTKSLMTANPASLPEK